MVDETLLAEARLSGPDSEIVRSGVNVAIDQLNEAGADIIICTCSTIAGRAEAEGAKRSVEVVRVDRPMAERAVAIGPRISVMAALESTIKPTNDLLDEVAKQQSANPTVSTHICHEAWSHFEDGDLDTYWAVVAADCDRVAASSDVVVLAQASMAGAADLCTTDVPVLSSPTLAVQAALRR